MEAPTNESIILEPEAESTSSITLSTASFWETAMPFSSQSSIDNKSRGDKSSIAKQQSNNVSVMAALLVLILSVLVGVVIFMFRT